jgi:cytochrome c peroxidase
VVIFVLFIDHSNLLFMKKLLLFTTLTVFLLACNKKEWTERYDANEFDQVTDLVLPDVMYTYTRNLPKYLQAVGVAPQPVSHLKAALGRVLFYDVNLSADRSVSCGSCHQQAHAFADPAPLSKGIYGRQSLRNSMSLANVASFSAYYGKNASSQQLLWDNRAQNVAQQATMAFLNDHEMGMTLDGVVERVLEKSYYKDLWVGAYGTFEPSANQILECLTEFVGAIGSHNSLLDRSLEMANGNFNFQQDSMIVTQLYYGGSDTTFITFGLPLMSDHQNQGRNIFIQNCSKCHSPILPLQTVQEACNGLDMTYTDQGKGSISGKSTDMGVFKSPSLRNIALTAPYMHDGRFKTLKEVIDFYSTGVKEHPNLHPEMRINGSTKRNFTESQKEALLAFLLTFTDVDIINDPRFSDPFWH